MQSNGTERRGQATTFAGTFNEAASLAAEIKRYARVFRLKLPALPKLPKLDAAKLPQSSSVSASVKRRRQPSEKSSVAA